MHASVCDLLADLVQNAIEAGASQVTVEVDTDRDAVRVTVTDNGKGMDQTTMARAMDPFYSEAGKHDRRRVGLGLPFLRQTVDAVGGTLTMRSEPGQGTVIRFVLDARHLDMPPMGDLPGTLLGLMTFPGAWDLTVIRKTPSDGYTVAKSGLREALGDLERAENLALARTFLTNQEQTLTQ